MVCEADGWAPPPKFLIPSICGGAGICVSHAIPGDADGAPLENHYPKEFTAGKSESFKIKSSD